MSRGHAHDPAAAGHLELTELQQAYWLGERSGLELGGVAAHAYIEYTVEACDVARLERAVRALVARHEALRAVVTEDGQLRLLRDVPPYEVGVLDLRERPADEVAAALDGVREDMTHHGPPTHRWPLIDVRVTRAPGAADRVHVSASLIVADGHAWHVLEQELHLLYTRPEAALPPLPTLADGRARLAELRTGEAHARSLAAWHERLASLPAAPDLPVVRAAGLATRFTARTHRLRRADWLALLARARAARVTATAALATVYADVVATYSKRRPFCLNLLVSLRDRLGARGVVDNLTDTLLLEVADTRGPFDERARALQRRLLADLHHAAAGGVEIVREAARRQGSGATASMPVVFSSELEDEAPALPGWTRVHERVQTSHVLVDYQVRLEEGAPVLHWETIDEAFPPRLVDDMFADCCERVARLARSQAAWADRRRAAVPARQLACRRAVNDTRAPVSDDLLHDGFLARAARQPDAPAVLTADRALTYGELLSRSRAVSAWLAARGAGPGALVAVLMERGWEQVVAVLGALGAGAAYLPLDPAFPPHRVAGILKQAGARLVLAQSHVPFSREGWLDGVEVLFVDAAEADAAAAAPTRASPDDLAYVIYTSGSTGTPKGVAITHRAALNTVRDINDRFGVGPGDRALALSALSFDLSVYDIFGLLAAGGAIVMPRPSTAADPAAWLELVASAGVTVWSSVPAYLQLLVEHLGAAPGAAPACPSLRLVMMSGDWIPVTLPDRVRAVAPAARQVSLGGATEAAIWSIYHPIEEVDPSWRSIPYGRPLANQWFHVLDDDLEHRPDHVPGHLYIGGMGLARGYHNDEELTRAAFIEHPATGERIYRTGDWGRYLPSGDIELLGREDGQVKLRGFRIELGEIEAVLREHPPIRDAAVLVRQHGGERQLVAYLVTQLSVAGASPVELDGAAVLDSRSRVQARVPFARRALARAAGRELAIELVSLSTGGVAHVSVAALPAEIAPGTHVTLSVSLGEGGERTDLSGVITRRRDGSAGVRFDGEREVRAVEETVQRIIDEAELSLEHLRRFVRARLPRYMEPAMFVLVDALPLSPTGKIDRRRLPALDVAPAAPREFVPPRTPAERALVRIWEELLGRPGLGATDNFFELGGHSMLAFRMMARIGRELGVELSLGALLDRPTVARLAELVADGAVPRATPVVALRAHGSEPPLVCVHPSGGNVVCYVELARALDDDQPVVALEARAGGDPDAAATCEEMAAAYVAALRQVRPSGPYKLAGWSSGGVVAYEMARLLREEGDEVPLLVLVDSWVPALVDDRAAPGDLPLLFARDLQGGAVDLAGLPRELAASGSDGLKALAAWARTAGVSADLDGADLEALFRVFSRNIEASLRYRPLPLAVPTLLVRAAERRFEDFPDPARMPAFGWDAVVPRALIEVEDVPGHHYTIMKSPAVDRVAALLAARRRAGQRRSA